ncbi:winged helix-turn-helix domain-containing protein [Microvirga tunisiensis]|uniref:OmpR/PhoB-type domain-containing protein n=1 Tax=Microvirga tunisiensis TaxID=2108360 RepID=A0A5N7MVR3_9HYPH|nr:winged helix-turn-helix domain-containing protein [Microvirga tunisiensis]MPR12539.1 hypothetical protein [Microvirga tunisiensis]MPR30549.1 hypothetical protein [Microvirga tunisiensis]
MQGKSEGKIYNFGNQRFNTKFRRITRRLSDKSVKEVPGKEASVKEVSLTAAEYSLLMAFLSSPGQILSRERLLMATHVHYVGIHDRSIDILVFRLRKKLEEDASNPKFIKTIRDAGYIFDPDGQSEALEGTVRLTG